MAEETGRLGFSPFFLEKRDELPCATPWDVQDATASLRSGRVRTAWIGGRPAVKRSGGRSPPFKVGRPPVLGCGDIRVHGCRSAASTARLGKRGRSRAFLGVFGNCAEDPAFAVEKGVRHRPVPLGNVARRRRGCGCTVLASEASLGRVIRRTNGRASTRPLGESVFGVGDLIVDHAEGRLYFANVVHRVFVRVIIRVRAS